MRAFHILVQHKLRTPLVSILSGLQLLKEREKSLSEEIKSELIQLACHNAEKLHSEIERITEFAQTMTTLKIKGRYPLRKLRALLMRLSIEQEIAPPEVTVEGDEDKDYLPLDVEDLTKIFNEVLGNAKKFHPQQAPHVEIKVVINAGQAHILVIDDGVCLSPEQLANAWRPYYQGEKYFTGSVAGMGIGLPTVSNIMERVNGRYQIMNRPASAGVIIALSLPLVTAN